LGFLSYIRFSAIDDFQSLLPGVSDCVARSAAAPGHVCDADRRGVHQRPVTPVVHTGTVSGCNRDHLGCLGLYAAVLLYLRRAPARFAAVLVRERQHENQPDLRVLGLQGYDCFRGQGIEAASAARAEGQAAGANQALQGPHELWGDDFRRLTELSVACETDRGSSVKHILHPIFLHCDCPIISLYCYKWQAPSIKLQSEA